MFIFRFSRSGVLLVFVPKENRQIPVVFVRLCRVEILQLSSKEALAEFEKANISQT